MTGVRILRFAEDLPAKAVAQLEAEAPHAAAWLIDVVCGRILAADAAGSTLFGLDTGGSLPILDAAMPALARLRGLAAMPDEDSATPERLVFWTRRGAVAPVCRVRFVRAAAEILAIVSACAITDTGEGLPPLFAGDDAAKLKEIARRIREGQMSAAPTDRRVRPESHLPAPSPASSPAERDGPTPAVPFSLRARLAHELKTPASAIAAAAEIMKDERFGPLGAARYVGYATDIHGSAQHMLGVIDRMLAESGAEPDAAARALEFAEIDAGEELRVSVSQLMPLAEQAGIALALDLSPGLPHVVADATSLRQMVFNLITNALKFTTRGGHVTVTARYSGDGPLAIIVSDTGAGMAVGEVERLLAPGRGRRGSRRTGPKGLGLGLPLVQALAAANGAELTIESTPGKGTSAAIVFEKTRVIPV